MPASTERLPWGYYFSFATSERRVHLPASIPLPAYVPPTAFLTLPTVCSPSSLEGLFHPPTTSEIHSSGVCSRQPTEPTHHRPVPLLPFAPFSYTRVAPTAPDRDARLQGFDLTADPLPPTSGLDPPAPRSPLKFSLLRAFLRTPWRRPHDPSAHDLPHRFLV